jgi:hypothetical protein
MQHYMTMKQARDQKTLPHFSLPTPKASNNNNQTKFSISNTTSCHNNPNFLQFSITHSFKCIETDLGSLNLPSYCSFTSSMFHKQQTPQNSPKPINQSWCMQRIPTQINFCFLPASNLYKNPFKLRIKSRNNSVHQALQVSFLLPFRVSKKVGFQGQFWCELFVVLAEHRVRF